MSSQSPQNRPAREAAGQIIRAALDAVDPVAAVRRTIAAGAREIVVAGVAYPLKPESQVFVVGAGKGSAAMAEGLEAVLGDGIAFGHVTVKDGHGRPLRRVSVGEASHPLPDARGVLEARKALEIADGAREGDLVICLISGGGSALWPAPAPGVTLEDKQGVTRALIACGASIDEINAIRKHLSMIKGGQLARAAAPARVASLLISDVNGDRLDVIASGPTCPDAHTFADALAVIDRYQIGPRLPMAVLTHLRDGALGKHPETPKPGDSVFERVQNVIIANIHDALKAASGQATSLGYRVEVVNSARAGDTVDLGVELESRIAQWQNAGKPGPACLLWGGETTMVLPPNPGDGGRNQHLALWLAQRIDGLPDVVFAALGTDGTDGPTDAAGGIVDGGTAGRVRDAGHDLEADLARCNSYDTLSAAGDLLVTGPTFTNVMDIQILLLGTPER